MNVLASQLLFYVVVGGISACVDIGLFSVLLWSSWPVLVASIVSFVAATIVNYLLSISLAFARGRYQVSVEVLRFWLVALVGLAINALTVWVLVDVVAMAPIPAKVLAVPIVFVWNFVGRRLLVFHKDRPPPPLAFAERLRARSRNSRHPSSDDVGPRGVSMRTETSKTATKYER
jgi:putative flippase GtrA